MNSCTNHHSEEDNQVFNRNSDTHDNRHMTCDSYSEIRTGAQRLKDTDIITMKGKFESQPLTGDWVEFPKLKQANHLGLLVYTDKVARL